MSDKFIQVCEELSSSDSSAAHAVLDHLSTVAENGPEYATDAAMLCEAENLRDYAEGVIAAFRGKQASAPAPTTPVLDLIVSLKACAAYVPRDGDAERDVLDAAEDAIRQARPLLFGCEPV